RSNSSTGHGHRRTHPIVEHATHCPTRLPRGRGIILSTIRRRKSSFEFRRGLAAPRSGHSLRAVSCTPATFATRSSVGTRAWRRQLRLLGCFFSALPTLRIPFRQSPHLSISTSRLETSSCQRPPSSTIFSRVTPTIPKGGHCSPDPAMLPRITGGTLTWRSAETNRICQSNRVAGPNAPVLARARRGPSYAEVRPIDHGESKPDAPSIDGVRPSVLVPQRQVTGRPDNGFPTRTGRELPCPRPPPHRISRFASDGLLLR